MSIAPGGSKSWIQRLTIKGKRRGKGHQKVTVEHVQVHARGQAVVGNVVAGYVRKLLMA